MATQILFRYVLLLSFGAIMIMSVSAESDSSESSQEKSDESVEENGNPTTTTTPTTTTAASSKADTKKIEKYALGSFRMTSDLKADDFKKFLKAMEFQKRDRNMIRNAPYIDVTISKIKKKKYNIKIFAGLVNVKDNTFTLGKEYNDKLFDGRTFKTTVNFEGKNKVIVDEKHAGFNCHHVFEFGKEELTGTLECNGVTAKQEFEKLEQPKPFQPPKFDFKFGK